MSMIQELRDEIAALNARLEALRKIYDRYRSEDAWIMSPLFLIGYRYSQVYRQMIRNLWVAVKTAMEGEHGPVT